MTKKTLFLFLPIFIVFFVWGLQVGDRFPRINNLGTFDHYGLEKEIKVHHNGQKTILLVFISQMEVSDPDLLGLWTLTYFPSEPYTTVLPIYPANPLVVSNLDNVINNSIQLKIVNNIPLLNDALLSKLDEANIWSSGYVLIDLYGLAKAINLSGGIDYLSLDSEDEKIIDQIYTYLADPSSSLTFQTLLLQHLCSRFTLLDSLSDLNDLSTLFPEHISGNIQPDVLLKDWREFIKAKNGSFCIFPNAEQYSQINE